MEGQNRKKDFILTVLLVIGILIVLFYPVIAKGQIPFASNYLVGYYNPWTKDKISGWVQGVPYKPVGTDDIRIFYPQRTFTLQTILKERQIPLWNPYSFSGNYHIGMSETAVFYPLFFLFFILPQIQSWTLLQLFEPIIAAIGIYLFVRLLVHRNIAAIFASIGFGFSGIVLMRMMEGLSVGHTLVWLPWAFWSVQAYTKYRKVRYLWILTAVLCFSLLAGWFQYTFYIFVLSCIYALYIRAPRAIYLPFVLTPLLTLYHSIPVVRMFLESPRGGQIEEYLARLHLLPIQNLWTLLYPDFFGNFAVFSFFGKSNFIDSYVSTGIIVFIFALFSINWIRSNTTIRFFWGIIIFILVIVINNPLSQFITSLSIPVFSTFIPDRSLVIVTFSLVVLSALGVEVVLENNTKSNRWANKVLLGLIVTMMLTYLIVFLARRFTPPSGIVPHWVTTTLRVTNIPQLEVMTRSIAIPSSILVIFILIWIIAIKLNRFIPLVILALCLAIGQQLYIAKKYISFSQLEFIYPQHLVFSYLQNNAGINRYVSLGSGHIASNIPMQYGILSPEGVGSMYSKRYGELLTFVLSNGLYSSPVPRIEISINPSLENFFGSKQSYILRFMQIDGIQYVVVRTEDLIHESHMLFDMSDYTLVWQNESWQIYRFKNSFPRYYLTNDFEVIPDQNQLLRSIFDGALNTKTVYLEEPPEIKKGKDTDGIVRLTRYSPNEILFTSNASYDGILYLSDTYTTAFKVQVDNKETKLFRANYAFRGVKVLKGKHNIEMYYDTKEINIGFLLSGLSLIAALVIFSCIYSRSDTKNLGKHGL